MNAKTANLMQLASVRRYRLTEGEEGGTNVLDCSNGTLRFLLNENKALDMMQLYHKGMNLSYLSRNAPSLRGGSFQKRFEGGMIYTVGLESAGSREGYPVHGSFHHIPARVTEIVCTEELIRIAAEIEVTQLFGCDLVMQRVIESRTGSGQVTMHDRLINRGFRDEDFCLLYHINLGYPFLGDDTFLQFQEKGKSEETTVPFRPKDESGSFSTVFFDLAAPRIRAISPALHKGFLLEYSGDTLPVFMQWNSYIEHDFCLALEPSTDYLDERFRYRKLPAGGHTDFSLSLTVC